MNFQCFFYFAGIFIFIVNVCIHAVFLDVVSCHNGREVKGRTGMGESTLMNMWKREEKYS